ncbi:3-oxoacyl-[acyl-carrier protein] reductase [Alkalihalobacillus xiaoxiensis]|uniref:3-oxoacyl-[acyl-carrier protein] reductase n=1 Tax=Shouchella xiaoxiensis TaxID=766895 RepID=A0ABS2SN02_9BACI|nr:3-oxoacyl-ACP reductase FabG [Shouchella xiaoxiensis]MBM7836893.1 3-oxoacyl-[acyl-carrier protein] reductase [Shouchella xiaoxiensis]
MRLKNKVVLITGAARGIGEATAKRFAQEGATLILTDLHEDALNELKQLLAPGDHSISTADVTDAAAMNALFERIDEAYGQIDIVINNAGVTADSTLAKMTEDQWDLVLNVNLKGAFIVGQAAAGYMKKQQSGVILNAASIVGLYGNFGQSNYAASKGGLISMTKTWAKELGKYGIRVNAVAPGFIETEMTAKMPEKVLANMKNLSPLNQLGSPEDIANTYLFLASDEAQFISGAVISVDGAATL